QEYTWNLESIYATDDAWEEDFRTVSTALPEIQKRQGTLAGSPQALFEALDQRDKVGEVLGRLYVYAHMRQHEDAAVSRYQALADRVTTLASELSAAAAFFTPEILAIPAEKLAQFVREEPRLAVYQHAFDEINRQRPHVLTPEIESLLAQAGEMASASERIFEIFNAADLKFAHVHDEEGNEAELTQGNYVPAFLQSQHQPVRKEAFEAMLGAYDGFRNTLATTYASHIKRDIFFARAHKYADSLHAALEPDNIPVSVYDNLVSTVRANLGPLNRYLTLRKKLMGLRELHMYDLYVPIVKEAEDKVTYASAQETVAQALAPLGADYVAAVRNGLASRWVDVLENKGKRPGAYSWGTYGTNPFILLNYQEKMESMFTLAHEMGHSMHSYHTRQSQPYPYADYTLFVAEVASTLNEALMTDYLLRTETDRAKRMYVLNHALEEYRGTLFRQTLFAEFEREAHEKAEAGEALTPELLCDRYKQLVTAYYGAECTVDDLIEIEWARIPHFYNSFYVYQYATGISASSALARGILDEGEPARQRYIRFLSAGSSDYSINLLKDAGVDLSTPEPVQRAITTFGRYLDQFEALLSEDGAHA
ncbi:MAG TPA: oligoendopeptidase F, partial [Ktedonobacterales bacterium]